MLVDAGSLLPPGRITVKVVESERGAIDHLKQVVIDGALGPLANSSQMTTGSYNYSSGAQSQDNIFIVSNHPGEVAQALAKFNHDWTANKSDPAWQIQPTGHA